MADQAAAGQVAPESARGPSHTARGELAPTDPFELGESCDHPAGDDLEHLADDLQSMPRVASKAELALGGLAFGQPPRSGAGDLDHAFFRRDLELVDAESKLDPIASARSPIGAPSLPEQPSSKELAKRLLAGDFRGQLEPIENHRGATPTRGELACSGNVGSSRDRSGEREGAQAGHRGSGSNVVSQVAHLGAEPTSRAGFRAKSPSSTPPSSAKAELSESSYGRVFPLFPLSASMSAEIVTERHDVDVVIIGGGVNGTGLARDCALRGIKVALFERNDIAFGASGNSSGMIHGGPRYLVYDPNVTYTSCLDSGHIQRIAPHLLFRIPFLMPVHAQRTGAKVALTLIDAFFDLYDKYQPLKRGKPHTRLTPEELNELEPGLVGSVVGGVAFDEWGIDGVRLCLGSLVDAIENGAEARVHCTVTEILRKDDGSVKGVRWRDRTSGETGSTTAKIVVNATGAWAPITASLGGLEPKAARLRPGKGIHIFYDRRLTNYAIVARTIDGRQIFVMPWQNTTVIGTTDDDYYGDLDRCVATADEARYLIQAVERVFPALKQARAIGTWAGVRPTLYAWGPNEDALSREHEVLDHEKHGADGLYSMIGGKLASYRIFSEEAADVVARRLGNGEACRTHTSSLPGGDEEVDPLSLAGEAGLEAVAATRLEYRHGSRARRVLERIHRSPRERAVVCECEPVLEAEVRYVVENELAQTVEDVSRRTRLGLGACGGMRCAARCGQIVADMTERSPQQGQRMALEFLESAARRRLSIIGADQARQEAFALASVRSELGLDRRFEEP